MWTYPAWNLWSGAQPTPPPPSRCEQILSRVRHPSFTAEQLDELLRGMSHRQLSRLWRESGRLLDSPLDGGARLNVVVLRARLLDLLEESRHGSTPGA